MQSFSVRLKCDMFWSSGGRSMKKTCMKLIKSGSKDICNVSKKILDQINAFFSSIHQKMLGKKICFHQNIKQHKCFQHLLYNNNKCFLSTKSAYQRDSSPKKDNCVIIYSPLGYSKPAWVSFFCWTQKKIFWRIWITKQLMVLFFFHSMEINTMEVKGDINFFSFFLPPPPPLSSKYLLLCSTEQTSRGWVNDDRIFIFGWTIPLKWFLKYNVTLRMEYWLLKIQLCITEINYILKCIKIENCKL